MRRTISNRANEGGTEDPFVYCLDLVKKHDYEGFLTASAYPTHLRNGYFALKALNVSHPTNINFEKMD
jgi:NADH dehydrogenase [ubiquinone] 1 alpha subcomplex assembly factor 6